MVRPGNGRRPARLPLSTRVNVVTVGRLVPWKQVDKVLQAIACLDGVGLAGNPDTRDMRGA
jgi:glycosyltransferase involved in cell wall biosynthesis